MSSASAICSRRCASAPTPASSPSLTTPSPWPGWTGCSGSPWRNAGSASSCQSSSRKRSNSPKRGSATYPTAEEQTSVPSGARWSTGSTPSSSRGRYFPAYDRVAFVWLFGGLEELPFHFPQLCLDIKQWAIELGDPELPPQKETRHHALADARWTKEAWGFLASLHPAGAKRCTGERKNPGQAGAGPPCRFVRDEDKPGVTAARGRPHVMCAKGATVKLRGAPPI